MPDFLAGQILTALHFTPTVSDTQATAITGITSTTFTAAGGTACGGAFVAPTTGRVRIHTQARLGQNGTNATEVTPVVREGATVGSGASIVAASSDNAVRWFGVNQSAGDRMGVSLLVEGLTPGSSYNVQLEHRVTTGTGVVALRHVIVSPAT